MEPRKTRIRITRANAIRSVVAGDDGNPLPKPDSLPIGFETEAQVHDGFYLFQHGKYTMTVDFDRAEEIVTV